jgi:hypothetical protein
MEIIKDVLLCREFLYVNWGTIQTFFSRIHPDTKHIAINDFIQAYRELLMEVSRDVSLFQFGEGADYEFPFYLQNAAP